MGNVIAQARLTEEFFKILDETFETHHGFFLDKGTSLFETLEAITAAEASRPVGGRCASLAAQVRHITFYLDVLERAILNDDPGKVDWGAIWRTDHAVTPAQWDDLRQQLRLTYQRVSATLRSIETWDNADVIGGALAIVVHTAYHLGEIRQALCILRA